MATILTFVQNPARTRPLAPNEATGAILMFTGIRYERMAPRPPERAPLDTPEQGPRRPRRGVRAKGG